MLTRSTLLLGPAQLAGELCLAGAPRGLVLIVHGNGRGSARHERVAQALQQRGLATLQFDPLTAAEAAMADSRADVDLQATRIGQVIDALPAAAAALPLGLLCSGAGAAAALRVAAERPRQVRAVVSRSGRPDLAGAVLSDVRSPTLLIVGGADTEVLRLNREAYAHLRCDKQIEAVPRATHLFMEAGTLEAVALRAGDWFLKHLPPAN